VFVCGDGFGAGGGVGGGGVGGPGAVVAVPGRGGYAV